MVHREPRRHRGPGSTRYAGWEPVRLAVATTVAVSLHLRYRTQSCVVKSSPHGWERTRENDRRREQQSRSHVPARGRRQVCSGRADVCGDGAGAERRPGFGDRDPGMSDRKRRNRATSRTPRTNGTAPPRKRHHPRTARHYSQELPECRAYEMVSPLDKQGYSAVPAARAASRFFRCWPRQAVKR